VSLPDLQRLFAFTDTLADAARAAILPYFRAPNLVENKGGDRFDPVTEADRAAEAAMRTLIEAEFPDHGILGEEYGEKPARSEFTWVLDPIDGTRAFIAGLPLWGVLIALSRDGKPIIGVMDQPYLDERFRGWGNGASLSARGITRDLRVRPCPTLSDAILSSTDVNLFAGEEADRFAAMRREVKLTRYGYDCYAYAMVALGGIDIVIESGLKPYDIQALIPIIEGAGGGVCAWNGGDAAQGGQVLAYGDTRVRDAALQVLRA
jgi:histidinol phosphatase-like enzyme (inositol monophosphatase family)